MIASPRVRLAGLAVALVTVPAAPDDVFTDPRNASFEVHFTSAPVTVADPEGLTTSYLVGVAEDTETVSVVPRTAFGAAPKAAATDRVLLFLAASGNDLEVLANTPTRLGPFPAVYFISRITLADERRAVLYGAAVIRSGDVVYVFVTDVGGDDADRARTFVESYTVVIDPLPPAPAASKKIPAGATVSFDGSWTVVFPAGADVGLRASAEAGFTYAEYAAIVGDDTLSVRTTELPAAIEWDPGGAASAEAERRGATVVDFEVITVGGSPGTRFALADGDNDTSADTDSIPSGDAIHVLMIRTGGLLYQVAYADGGESSDEAIDEFLASFSLR